MRLHGNKGIVELSLELVKEKIISAMHSACSPVNFSLVTTYTYAPSWPAMQTKIRTFLGWMIGCHDSKCIATKKTYL
jgi:hypothetical protein